MFEKYLQDIGLNDKEAVVYLALLSVEHASVLDLANKTKIKRPTVYVVLELLAKKGLVSETTIGKKTHYHAEPPERLETFVERRKIALEESQKTLKDIIPQIKSISRDSGERPVVKYFEGRDGIISSSEELLQDKKEAGGEMYMIYPKDDLEELFSESERSKLREIRISKNIKSKVLYTSFKSDKPSDTTGDRIKIDQNRYPINCDVSIYGDKVRISILGKKLSSIFIRSKDLAVTLRSLIDLVFDKDKQNS